MTTNLSPTKQALTTPEMLEYVGLSRTGLHRVRNAPNTDFPQPYVLPAAPHRNLWSRTELDAWIERNRQPSLMAEPAHLRGTQRGKSKQHPYQSHAQK